MRKYRCFAYLQSCLATAYNESERFCSGADRPSYNSNSKRQVSTRTFEQEDRLMTWKHLLLKLRRYRSENAYQPGPGTPVDTPAWICSRSAFLSRPCKNWNHYIKFASFQKLKRIFRNECCFWKYKKPLRGTQQNRQIKNFREIQKRASEKSWQRTLLEFKYLK